MGQFEDLIAEVRSCRRCAESPLRKPLPHAPRPVLQPSQEARILIAGQAPGTRVHASGLPFTDPSGDRLRSWLGIGKDEFYDSSKLAILPMGFCFPGLTPSGADLPPRPECAPQWRSRVLAHMPQIRLVICLGAHAMRWHMGASFPGSVDTAVRNWQTAMRLSPAVMPLPHPSWRNNAWLKSNPWFESELLPVLRTAVAQLLDPRLADEAPQV